jgi:tRNA pseudouridine55 synthase
LLPIAFGEATKFCGYFLDAEKGYETTLTLGVRTSTGDLTGEVLERRPVQISRGQVESVLRSFLGDSLQVPPMYSAIKREGVPLYKLARRGEVVAREPRSIHIRELELIRIDAGEVDLRVRCSKGTYIRVLGEDIGNALGCGASLKRLRRISVAAFDIAASVTLDALDRLGPDRREAMLLPPDAGLGHMPAAVCEPAVVAKLRLGQSVRSTAADLGSGQIVRIYQSENHEFIGLARVADGLLHPVRLIVPASAKIA